MRKLGLAVALAATLAGVGRAEAQNWPIRPLTMVVPFAAGGVGDVLGRILASPLRALGEKWAAPIKAAGVAMD